MCISTSNGQNQTPKCIITYPSPPGIFKRHFLPKDRADILWCFLLRTWGGSGSFSSGILSWDLFFIWVRINFFPQANLIVSITLMKNPSSRTGLKWLLYPKSNPSRCMSLVLGSILFLSSIDMYPSPVFKIAALCVSFGLVRRAPNPHHLFFFKQLLLHIYRHGV